jgi:hypothetical protein
MGDLVINVMERGSNDGRMETLFLLRKLRIWLNFLLELVVIVVVLIMLLFW